MDVLTGVNYVHITRSIIYTLYITQHQVIIKCMETIWYRELNQYLKYMLSFYNLKINNKKPMTIILTPILGHFYIIISKLKATKIIAFKRKTLSWVCWYFYGLQWKLYINRKSAVRILLPVYFFFSKVRSYLLKIVWIIQFLLLDLSF